MLCIYLKITMTVYGRTCGPTQGPCGYVFFLQVICLIYLDGASQGEGGVS